MPRMCFSRSCFVALILLTLPALALAQNVGPAEWTEMGQFSQPVNCIYFLPSDGDPVTGYIGTGDFMTGHGEIYRTTDSGHSWARTDFHPLESESVTDIQFKDALVGWAATSTSADDQGKIYKTTDGGLTWSALAVMPGVYLGLGYSASSGLLFAARGGLSPLVSSDEGNTWHTVLDGVVTSFSFVDTQYGFASGAHPFMPTGATFCITTDGGITWRPTTLSKECYQPVMIAGTHEIFALEEGSGALYNSRDLGVTWDTLYHFPAPRQWMSGCIRGNKCGRLYAQAGYSSELGLAMSDDRGRTWSDLRPPALGHPISNSVDTRFYEQADVVYAASFARAQGDKHTLFRYRRSTTNESVGNRPFALEHTLALASPGCEFIDSTITIAYPQDCAVAKLVSAEFSDSLHFQLLSETLPKRLAALTPLRIAYVPENGAPLTAQLVLRYMIGDATFFDTVSLTGSLTEGHKLSRLTLASDAHTSAMNVGDTLAVNIALADDLLGASGLQSLDMALGYDRDMMTLVRVRAADPWQLRSLTSTDSSAALTIDALSSDHAKGTTLATAFFRLVLSRDSTCGITLRDVTWNGAGFTGCTMAHRNGLHSIGIELGEACGNDLIRRQLSGATAIALIAETNTGDGVTASIRSQRETHGTLSLVNDLGETLSQQPVEIHIGTTSARLTKPRAAGVYYVVMTVDGSVQSRSIVLP